MGGRVRVIHPATGGGDKRRRGGGEITRKAVWAYVLIWNERSYDPSSRLVFAHTRRQQQQ